MSEDYNGLLEKTAESLEQAYAMCEDFASTYVEKTLQRAVRGVEEDLKDNDLENLYYDSLPNLDNTIVRYFDEWLDLGRSEVMGYDLLEATDVY